MTDSSSSTVYRLGLGRDSVTAIEAWREERAGPDADLSVGPFPRNLELDDVAVLGDAHGNNREAAVSALLERGEGREGTVHDERLTLTQEAAADGIALSVVATPVSYIGAVPVGRAMRLKIG